MSCDEERARRAKVRLDEGSRPSVPTWGCHSWRRAAGGRAGARGFSSSLRGALSGRPSEGEGAASQKRLGEMIIAFLSGGDGAAAAGRSGKSSPLV